MKKKNQNTYFKGNTAFYIFTLIIIVLIIFNNTFDGIFLNWDDTIYTILNPLIRKPISFESFKQLYNSDNHISIVLYSFLIQYNLWGFDTFTFHVVNVILHAINAILVYLICKSLIKENTLSFIIALLFAIHPLRSETVGWIIQRKDIMYSFFFLLSIVSYQKFYKNKNILYFLCIIICAYLSSLCKIQSFCLPFVILLFEYYYKQKIDNKSFVLFFAVLFAQYFYRYNLQGSLILSFTNIVFFFVFPCYYLFNNDFFYKLVPKGIKFLNPIIIKLRNDKIDSYIFLIFIIYYVENYRSSFIFFTLFFPFVFISFLRKKISDKSWFARKMLNRNYFETIIALSVILLIFSLNFSSNKTVFLLNVLFDSIICIFISYFLYLRLFNRQFNKLKILNIIFRFSFNTLVITFFSFLFIKKQLFLFYRFGNNYSLLTQDIIVFIIPILILKSDIIYNFFKQHKRIFALLILIFVLSIIMFVLNYSHYYNIDNSLTIPIINRIYLAFFSLNYYLLSFIYPFNLSAMHTYPEGLNASLPIIYKISVIFFLAIAGCIAWGLYKLKDKTVRHQIIFGLLFFLLSISLVLHIMPIKGKVVVADRYTYLAYFGLIFAFISLIDYFLKNKSFNKYHSPVKILGIIIILVFSVQTYSRNNVWKNDVVFWSDVINKNPLNHYAYYSLGLYYYQHANYDKAIEQYNAAINLYHNDFEYYANRGACYIRTKKVEQAIKDFESAIALNPNDYASYNNRGISYLNTGNLTASKMDFEAALKRKPDYEEAKTNLENVNMLIESIKEYDQDLKQSRKLSDYYNKIGLDLAMNGNMQEGLTDFQLSVRYDTTNIDAIKNRGNANASLKQFYEAEKDFLKILSIYPDEAGAYLNLGNIKHEIGDSKIACEYWNKASSLGLQDAKTMIERYCK